MQKPWTRVISDEPNSHVVRSRTGRHDVATDGVGVIVCRGARTSDDVECVLWDVVLVQVEREIRGEEENSLRAGGMEC